MKVLVITYVKLFIYKNLKSSDLDWQQRLAQQDETKWTPMQKQKSTEYQLCKQCSEEKDCLGRFSLSH